MMASFQNLLLQGFFFISRIIFFHLQKQLLEVILHLCIKEGFFLLKHSCIFFFSFENWKGNTYEICCFDMLSLRNLFLLNLIVLYKANFFLFLTLLFKVIFRSVFINGLYFCRIFIQQCTCIRMYIFAYLSEWFLVWCNHVLYLRVEISECFYSSEAADLCNINCDILVPSDFNIYHFHCWCNLSELTSAFFLTFVVIHWRCFIIMSFYQKLSLTYYYRSVLFVWY